MGGLSSTEQAIVERAVAEPPMLDQVLEWSAVNSGSRNIDGLGQMAALLGDAFSALPEASCSWTRRRSTRSTHRAGKIDLQHGRNLHLKVRPDAPVQLLFTGHMDTVFAADHRSSRRAGWTTKC